MQTPVQSQKTSFGFGGLHVDDWYKKKGSGFEMRSLYPLFGSV